MNTKKIVVLVICICGVFLLVAFGVLGYLYSKISGPSQQLLEALEERDQIKAKLAIEAGADPNMEIIGMPLAFMGIKEGNDYYVKTLIENGADVNKRNKFGRTLLHEAALYGHVEIVEYLLNHGADVNARNQRGETPLFYAAGGILAGPKMTERHEQIARLLLKYGADPNGKNQFAGRAMNTHAETAWKNSIKSVRGADLSKTVTHLQEVKEAIELQANRQTENPQTNPNTTAQAETLGKPEDEFDLTYHDDNVSATISKAYFKSVINTDFLRLQENFQKSGLRAMEKQPVTKHLFVVIDFKVVNDTKLIRRRALSFPNWYLEDNFGNMLDLNLSPEDSEGLKDKLRFPDIGKIVFQSTDEPLQKTEYLKLRVAPGLFGNERQAVFEIPMSFVTTE